MTAPRFTVFIPTYNRAPLLPRAFASLEIQTLRDFEVIIVDDGSTDDTESLVAAWQQRVDFPVTYIKQANAGKPSAHNVAVNLAQGTFFFTLDSDDRLLPDSLERILRHWDSIPEADRPHYAGIEGLIESMDGQHILTQPYPESPMDANYLVIHFQLHIQGDKKHALRTDILKQYLYPVIPGEPDLRESIIWKRMAHTYKIRYVNDPLQQVEYQPDGLTSKRSSLRFTSPRSYHLFYLEDLTLHYPWLNPNQRRRSTLAFIRFSLLAGIGLGAQYRLIPNKALWLMLAPLGWIRWLKDLYRQQGFLHRTSRPSSNHH